MKNCARCILKEIETMRSIIEDINQRADYVEETLLKLISECQESSQVGIDIESEQEELDSDRNSDTVW